MFDKLKKALSSVGIRNIGQKEISEKEIEQNLFDLQLALLESDVAQEVIDDLSANLKKELLGLKLEKGQQQNVENLIRIKLQNAVTEMFAKVEKIDLIQKIKAKKESRSGPFVIVFLGINGTGKTTTVAKMANLLRKNGCSVVLAAGDTHRAGAIEQLTQHAEKLSLKVISQRYGADPSAVGRDAVDYGRKHYIDVVLIDTAGRMQTAKNLMDEISKIVRVVKPDMKLFVGDSLAGNDTINQAREFFQYTDFDGAILTKIDADAKGGAAISIAHITSKPILYMGIGQGYDNIIPFEPDKFIESIFSDTPITNITDISSSTTQRVSYAELQEPAEVSPPSASSDPNTTTRERERREESESAIPLSTLSTSEAITATNVQKDMSVIVPTIEKEGEESEGKKEKEKIHIEKQPTKSTLTEEYPTLSKEKQEKVLEKDEGKKEKRRLFGRFFGRKDKEEGERDQMKENEKEKILSARLTKDEKQIEDKSSEKQQESSNKSQKQEKDNVVYLSDEDIDDLLK
jgi:fused signal recognition particle receptor